MTTPQTLQADGDLLKIIDSLTPDQSRRLLQYIQDGDSQLFGPLARKAYPAVVGVGEVQNGDAPEWATLLLQHRIDRTAYLYATVGAQGRLVGGEQLPDGSFTMEIDARQWDLQVAPSPAASESGLVEPDGPDLPHVEIFTDGACSGNPGPGGWGAILRSNGKELELSGGEGATTNNRMEMMAAIASLEALEHPCRVTLTTDSSYVKDGITKWVHGWKRNGWRTGAKKEVKNRDLWERLLEAAARHEVQWAWVRGHNGHPENERADALACAAIPHIPGSRM